MSFIGEGAHNELWDILEVIDLNESLISEEENQKKLKMDNILLRDKITNMVEDLHYKTIRYLMLNYDVILLPDFKISGMVKKHNISNRAKRMLYALSFYTFKERMIYACKVNNKTLCIVNESYTSKTCSCCGNLNDVGGREDYHCTTCDFRIDRDVNTFDEVKKYFYLIPLVRKNLGYCPGKSKRFLGLLYVVKKSKHYLGDCSGQS